MTGPTNLRLFGRAAMNVRYLEFGLLVSTRAEVLDAGHNGKKLSSIDTGDGVDDLNYSPSTHMLYVGAAKDARLTVARGAVLLRRAVETQIYGVSPLDPLVLAAVTVVLAAVALAACGMPARRAMRVDPVVVLTEQ